MRYIYYKDEKIIKIALHRSEHLQQFCECKIVGNDYEPIFYKRNLVNKLDYKWWGNKTYKNEEDINIITREKIREKYNGAKELKLNKLANAISLGIFKGTEKEAEKIKKKFLKYTEYVDKIWKEAQILKENLKPKIKDIKKRPHGRRK